MPRRRFVRFVCVLVRWTNAKFVATNYRWRLHSTKLRDHSATTSEYSWPDSNYNKIICEIKNCFPYFLQAKGKINWNQRRIPSHRMNPPNRRAFGWCFGIWRQYIPCWWYRSIVFPILVSNYLEITIFGVKCLWIVKYWQKMYLPLVDCAVIVHASLDNRQHVAVNLSRMDS